MEVQDRPSQIEVNTAEIAVESRAADEKSPLPTTNWWLMNEDPVRSRDCEPKAVVFSAPKQLGSALDV